MSTVRRATHLNAPPHVRCPSASQLKRTGRALLTPGRPYRKPTGVVPIAKAAIDYSGFVSLSQMLDCLHDGDVAALCRPARFCRYSPRFLASCLTRLKKLSVRVRGIVDRGDAEWVELLDYRIGYLRVPMRGAT